MGLSPPSGLLPVPGVRLASGAAGIRYRGRDDLVLVALDPGTVTAAVFTRNRFCAAPVQLARDHLARAAPRYWLINAGNANAGTGAAGLEAARATCALVAERGGVAPEAVLPFSTGVIGEPLPVAPFAAALPDLFARLDGAGWAAAARAIMTTDTVPKAVSRQVEVAGRTVTITGMSKGAGMIRPDMATMLAFIATDARIAPAALPPLLGRLVDDSFNRITVDGDTSTNDACVLAATGAAGVAPLEGPEAAAFEAALRAVFLHLAQAIVRDGEGATKFVTVRVSGARDRAEADVVAYTVAHSPLVKTALFASDPNWGRILAAVGRAPLPDLDLSRVDIRLGDVTVIRGGEPDPDYSEAAGQAAFAPAEIEIAIALGRGRADTVIWTTDLSHGYVRINAEYRT